MRLKSLETTTLNSWIDGNLLEILSEDILRVITTPMEVIGVPSLISKYTKSLRLSSKK
jgi:hypothetical protein